MKTNKVLAILFLIITTLCSAQSIENLILPTAWEYQQEYYVECLADTLRVTLFEKGLNRFEDEFLIDFGDYGELLSMIQLNDWGYKYLYRIVKNYDLTDIEYIFVKRPTFEGYVEWRRNRENFQQKYVIKSLPGDKFYIISPDNYHEVVVDHKGYLRDASMVQVVQKHK